MCVQGYCMKQALLMNPDNMKDLLSGSSPAPGPASAPGPGPQRTLGSSHSHFTSRRDWQAVTVSPSYDMHISRTCQLYLHCSKLRLCTCIAQSSLTWLLQHTEVVVMLK